MKTTYGGGNDVKASELSVGDTIRSPRNPKMILIVESVGGVIFARGYESKKRKEHIFLQPYQTVTLVTKTETGNTEGV